MDVELVEPTPYVKGINIKMAVQGESGQPLTVLTNCNVAWIRDNEFGVQFLWQ